MQRTLIAVFDRHSDAQSAIDALLSSGFSRPHIRLTAGDPTGGASAISGDQVADAPRSSGSFADGIKNFLGTLFGTDNSEYVQNYSDAVTHGHHVLTLTADDGFEAERACAIVDRFDPVDIDERAAQWRGGVPQPPRPQQHQQRQQQQQRQQNSASASQHSVQGDAAALQGGQVGGSQQRGNGVKVFTHEAVATPNATEAAIDADDAYCLRHYQRNYAASGNQYSHYAPAYKFGADMATSKQHRGAPWADVKPELEPDRQGGNPGSAWGRFKALVRYGWEREGYVMGA